MGIFNKVEEKKPLQKKETDYSKVNNLLSEDSKVIGNISFKSNVIILGYVKGEVSSENSVTVKKDGFVEGTIASNKISIEGKVQGNISTKGTVIVQRGGIVTGNISCTELNIEGSVKGDINVSGTTRINESSQYSGNIKTSNIFISEKSELKIDSLQVTKKQEESV